MFIQHPGLFEREIWFRSKYYVFFIHKIFGGLFNQGLWPFARDDEALVKFLPKNH